MFLVNVMSIFLWTEPTSGSRALPSRLAELSEPRRRLRLGSFIPRAEPSSSRAAPSPSRATSLELKFQPYLAVRVCSDTTCNTLAQIRLMSSPPIGADPCLHSTPLTLSSSLRVKGLTRRCYIWYTRVYMLVLLSLNYQCGTKPTTQLY